MQKWFKFSLIINMIYKYDAFVYILNHSKQPCVRARNSNFLSNIAKCDETHGKVIMYRFRYLVQWPKWRLEPMLLKQWVCGGVGVYFEMDCYAPQDFENYCSNVPKMWVQNQIPNKALQTGLQIPNSPAVRVHCFRNYVLKLRSWNPHWNSCTPSFGFENYKTLIL